MTLYLDVFCNANDRKLDFFCQIDIFSEAISSSRTYFVIDVLTAYLDCWGGGGGGDRIPPEVFAKYLINNLADLHETL